MNRLCLTVFFLALFIILLQPLTKLSFAASQDDILERIRHLEIQIQQLKALKEQQKLSEDKEQQCLKPVGHARFCKCIAQSLPKEVSFEQYLHFLVTTKVELKYETMSLESRQAVDAALAAREKCTEKDWLK